MLPMLFGQIADMKVQLIPCRAVEREKPLRPRFVIGGDRRELEKIANENDLEAAETLIPIRAGDAANLAQHLQKVAAQHRDFIDDEHVSPPDSIAGRAA